MIWYRGRKVGVAAKPEIQHFVDRVSRSAKASEMEVKAMSLPDDPTPRLAVRAGDGLTLSDLMKLIIVIQDDEDWDAFASPEAKMVCVAYDCLDEPWLIWPLIEIVEEGERQ